MADDDRRVSDYDPKVGHTIEDHGAKAISPGQAALAAGNIQIDRGWATARTGFGWADTGVGRPSGDGLTNNNNGLEQTSMTRGWAAASPRGLDFGLATRNMDSGVLSGAWANGPIATRDASIPVPGTAPAASASAAPAAAAPAASAPSGPGAAP